MQKAEWWEQQAKQNKDKKEEEQEKEPDKDKDKIISQLKAEINDHKKMIKEFFNIFDEALNPKYTDAEVGRSIRDAARKAAKQYNGGIKEKARPRERKRAFDPIGDYNRLFSNDKPPPGLEGY